MLDKDVIDGWKLLAEYKNYRFESETVLKLIEHIKELEKIIEILYEKLEDSEKDE